MNGAAARCPREEKAAPFAETRKGRGAQRTHAPAWARHPVGGDAGRVFSEWSGLKSNWGNVDAPPTQCPDARSLKACYHFSVAIFLVYMLYFPGYVHDPKRQDSGPFYESDFSDSSGFLPWMHGFRECSSNSPT